LGWTEDLWSIPLVDRLLQRFPHKDIAAALQRVLEEVVVKMVTDGLQLTGAPDVVLAGGVFSNVKLNQPNSRTLAYIQNIYIHPGWETMAVVGAAYLGQEVLRVERGVEFRREFLKNGISWP